MTEAELLPTIVLNHDPEGFISCRGSWNGIAWAVEVESSGDISLAVELWVADVPGEALQQEVTGVTLFGDPDVLEQRVSEYFTPVLHSKLQEALGASLTEAKSTKYEEELAKYEEELARFEEEREEYKAESARLLASPYQSWLVTYVRRTRSGLDTHSEALARKQHPGEWLVAYRGRWPDLPIHIVSAIPISEEVADRIEGYIG